MTVTEIITPEALRDAVAASTSWTGVCGYLGVRRTPAARQNLMEGAERHGLSTAHFSRHGWSGGLTADSDKRVAKRRRANIEVL